VFLVIWVIKERFVDPDFFLGLWKNQEPQKVNLLEVRLELPLPVGGAKAGTKIIQHDVLLFLELPSGLCTAISIWGLK